MVHRAQPGFLSNQVDPCFHLGIQFSVVHLAGQKTRSWILIWIGIWIAGLVDPGLMTPDCITVAHFWQDPPCQDRSDDFAEPRGQTVRAISRGGNEKEQERQRETLRRESESCGGGEGGCTGSCSTHTLLSYFCFRRDESLRDLHLSVPARRESNRYHYLTVPTYLFQITVM